MARFLRSFPREKKLLRAKPQEGGDRAARAAARARAREVGLGSASHELVAEPPEEDGDAGGGGPLNSESKAGLFGKGAYKDEPWGLVAMRKRIYSCRKFYDVRAVVGGAN